MRYRAGRGGEEASGCRAEQHLVLLWGSCRALGSSALELPQHIPPARCSLAAKELCPGPSGSLRGYAPVSSLPNSVTTCPGTPLSVSRLPFRVRQVSLLCVLPRLTYSPVPSLPSCLCRFPLSLCSASLSCAWHIADLFSRPVFLYLCAVFHSWHPPISSLLLSSSLLIYKAPQAPSCLKQSRFMFLYCVYLLFSLFFPFVQQSTW